MHFRERLALARITIQASISIFVLSFCGYQLTRPNCDRYELTDTGQWRLKYPQADMASYIKRGCVSNNEIALYWSGITSVLASWLPSPLESGTAPEQQQTITADRAYIRQRRGEEENNESKVTDVEL